MLRFRHRSFLARDVLITNALRDMIIASATDTLTLGIRPAPQTPYFALFLMGNGVFQQAAMFKRFHVVSPLPYNVFSSRTVMGCVMALTSSQ